ncbi:MAG: hypothetical protein DWB56_00270 [Candidatus Jettenia sp.]|uniref:hypothetical protein n=1 Tax=Candidatus Jettenia sp. AMX1 TaxID=2293637 RepID=UPI00058D3ADA|nr:hypothetical protein [Candidatus Jettenia sp. AMX1]MBC6927388.1 hypothetical protein [Candidatus Jettenia sp.]NUN22138.1 hypothetical protein [Candidatus Jettenia caeni]KAA0251763.1 MAG: hypothetical protein EDM77_00270 [Candidatus Jettenia sp. AMX1]MCE7879071.1 hypothetical protein [Candidatus Jettenia sp. AMX1]MCQ3925817.1 hypothetical protein [Candidatus Jettenia sp.]
MYGKIKSLLKILFCVELAKDFCSFEAKEAKNFHRIYDFLLISQMFRKYTTAFNAYFKGHALFKEAKYDKYKLFVMNYLIKHYTNGQEQDGSPVLNLGGEYSLI